ERAGDDGSHASAAPQLSLELLCERAHGFVTAAGLAFQSTPEDARNGSGHGRAAGRLLIGARAVERFVQRHAEAELIPPDAALPTRGVLGRNVPQCAGDAARRLFFALR